MPNYPENMPEVSDAIVIAGDMRPQNLRYRRYVSQEVHFMYNMKMVSLEEMTDGRLEWLLYPNVPNRDRELDEWRLWDRRVTSPFAGFRILKTFFSFF